jgi:nitrite reductase/ring-hydroxylating ferredoxin subunit
VRDSIPKLLLLEAIMKPTRCSHTNAPLSLGTLDGKVVTCLLHGARFDTMTGFLHVGH